MSQLLNLMPFSSQIPEESLVMKLSLTKVVNGCRLGTIQHLGKAGDCTVDIPGCLLYTRTGSAPHLTHQTLQNIHGVPAMAQLTLSSLWVPNLVVQVSSLGCSAQRGFFFLMCICRLKMKSEKVLNILQPLILTWNQRQDLYVSSALHFLPSFRPFPLLLTHKSMRRSEVPQPSVHTVERYNFMRCDRLKAF